MASSSDVNKKVAYSIARHLQSQVSSGVLNEDEKEGIDVAMQCVCQAYRLNLGSEADRQRYGIKPTLQELVTRTAVKESDLSGGPSVEVSDEDKKTAEAYKQQGNMHLKADRIEDALHCYTEALTKDPSNAMFYCNRAATYIKLNKLDLATTDCKKAISLNPDYARAHGRLGFIYSTQGKLELSKECFKKAIQLDPDNDNYRSNLQAVEDQIRGPAPPPPQPPPQGPAAGGPEGGAGIGAGLGAGLGGLMGSGMAGLLQNPGFMNMATTLMQNPTFQNMASQMMARGVMTPNEVTPEVISEVSQAAREIQQTNPEVIESLQRQVFQGMAGPAGQQQQQQDQPQQQPSGEAGDQAGPGRADMDGETKSSGETKGPSSDDKGD